MPFEIIGEITDIEVIATGNTIRDIARLKKNYGSLADGANSKGLRWCVSLTGEYVGLNDTGMRRMALAKKKSSVNVIWTRQERLRNYRSVCYLY